MTARNINMTWQFRTDAVVAVVVKAERKLVLYQTFFDAKIPKKKIIYQNCDKYDVFFVLNVAA